MKGTVDKLLNFMKLSDDEEYDEEYEEYEDDEEEEEEPRSTFSFFKKKEPEVEEESSNSKISQPFDNTITASREAKKRRFTSTGSKVVSMNGRGVEVYVIKPQDFAEAQTAADLLKEGRTDDEKIFDIIPPTHHHFNILLDNSLRKYVSDTTSPYKYFTIVKNYIKYSKDSFVTLL